MTQRTLIFDAPLTESDAPRIGKQLAAVQQVMGSGKWYTLEQLQLALGGMGIVASTQSISARVRDLRKPRFGSHTVERQAVGGGLFQYRLTE